MALPKTPSRAAVQAWIKKGYRHDQAVSRATANPKQKNSPKEGK